MSVFDLNRTNHDAAAFFNRPGKLLADVFGVIAAWNDARITRNALSKLSNRELEDIGLVRGDIDHVAATSNLR